MNPRKGLKRHGMSSYVVSGPSGTFVIQRTHHPLRYKVRPVDWHETFALRIERRLTDARRFAEERAGT